jgi:hypothetical protein
MVVEVVVATGTVEVDSVVAVVAADVVSQICSLNSPVPSADGTNKDAGRRVYLFQLCTSRWEQTLVRDPFTSLVIQWHIDSP